MQAKLAGRLPTEHASGLASTGVQKLVGNGLYIKKGGCVCEIETDGWGLYLEPTTGKGFSKLGDGFYLKKEGHITTVKVYC